MARAASIRHISEPQHKHNQQGIIARNTHIALFSSMQCSIDILRYEIGGERNVNGEDTFTKKEIKVINTPIYTVRAWTTHELQSSSLSLLVTTQFEAITQVSSDRVSRELSSTTNCLHRFRANCILYLHTVHSNRSTTFFVVFAYEIISASRKTGRAMWRRDK